VRTLFYLCLLFVCGQSIAQGESSTANNSNPQYSQVGQWQFSIALGIGQKSNPLVGGKDIPIYVIPSVYYYGESIYFDDGVLGYSFFENQRFTVSTLVKLNAHAANFYRWHPGNIFIPSTQSLDSLAPATDTGKDEQTDVDIEQLAKRKWALDGGLQLNYFADNHLMFQARWSRDISNVYRGDSISLKLEKSMSLSNDNQFQLKVSVGADWHSANLVDYYYGVSARDDVDSSLQFTGKSSVNWFASTTLTYHISSQWRAVMTLQTSKLDNNISDSPLVKDSTINTTFIGVAYDF